MKSNGGDSGDGLSSPEQPAEDALLILVTGASRGFGRAVAVAACRHFARVDAVLTARSMGDLRITKDLMMTENQRSHRGQTQPDNNVGCRVSLRVSNLGDMDSLGDSISALLGDMESLSLSDSNEAGRRRGDTGDENTERKSYKMILIVNNAGSIGHVGRASTASSLQQLKQNIDLNVTSALWLSTRFARWGSDVSSSPKAPMIIVNVSSLVALEDFPTLACYSAAKAARDKFHSVMAKEEEKQQRGPIKILNYAPGPLETAMVDEIRASSGLDSSLRDGFDAQLLNPDDSAEALLRLVISGKYKSGAHVDYYDVVPK